MRRKNDFLFTRDSGRFYFPWMCWLMVFIGTFICGGGMLICNSLTSWQRGVSESLTVQINTYDEEGRDRGELVTLDVEKALSILKASLLDNSERVRIITIETLMNSDLDCAYDLIFPVLSSSISSRPQVCDTVI